MTMAKRILLVDDEGDVLEATRNVLKRLGYEVEIAQDGVTALQKIQDDPAFDLIFLDVQMPDMNGYTFMFELYREEKNRNIPIIVVSAYSEMAPIFKHRGVKDYLVKPVRMEELLEKVKQFVGPPK